MKNLIQIGSNTGDERIFKLVYDEQIDLCIYIDPNIDALKKCKERWDEFFNKNSIKLNKSYFLNGVISNKSESEVDFFVPRNNNVSAHGNIISNQFLGGDKEYDVIRVKNYNINGIFDHFKLSSIDYLFIDAEGCDKEIIYSIDWNRVRIKNLQFEFTHWDGYQGYISNDLNEFIFTLLMRDYIVEKVSATDILCKHKNSINI
jgi:FkbM family methyltransferase